MTTPEPISNSIRRMELKGAIAATARRAAAALFLATLYLQVAPAAEPVAPPAMPPVAPAPAGQYQLDKSHASLLLRVSHMGFSTYTTRFSRYDAELTFDPNNIPASKVVTTIDTSSFQMDGAPQMCLDIMNGPQMLDIVKFPQIMFKSDQIRMTGAKSMTISGTLTIRGISRPVVLVATFNGGYSGIPNIDPHARIGFSAHGSFKRSEFGMAFGIPAPGTIMGVGDLIDISIEAEFAGPALRPG